MVCPQNGSAALKAEKIARYPWNTVVQFFRLQSNAEFLQEVGNQETHNKIEYVRVRKGSRVRPTGRAYSDADPGLVCPTAAAAAAAAVAAVAAADDLFLFTEKKNRQAHVDVCWCWFSTTTRIRPAGLTHRRFDYCGC